jgi:hypothetical protein
MRGLLRAGTITCVLLLSAREGAASPGSFVYVAAPSPCIGGPANCNLNLFVYDAATSALVTTVLIATNYNTPSPGLAISPDGSRVYVSVPDFADSKVIVVDATRHQVIGSFAAPAGSLAVSRDGRILFIAAGNSIFGGGGANSVHLIDTATGQEIVQIPPADGEVWLDNIAADPVRDRVYWTTRDVCFGTFHAYDTTLGSEIPVQGSSWSGVGPFSDMFASRDGTRLYLTEPVPLCGPNRAGFVMVIDPATFAQLGTFSTEFPYGAVDAPGRHRIYAWGQSYVTPPSIWTFDRDTFANVARLAVNGVTSLAVTSDELRGYATTPNSLTVLDLVSNAVASVIPLPGTPSKAVTTPPAQAANVCSYRVDTHQSPWSLNGGSAPVALTTNCTWAASSNAPWVHISTQSGTGSATVTISVDSNFSATNRTGTVTIGGQLVNVTQASIASTAPFGTIDTPADYAAGLSGAIAVTGWALDDVGVKDVRIYRDPVAGEPPGQQVFIGYATFVDGARPDVKADYPSFPYASRAGWGLQLLTNMLPNQGTGTYRVYAFADDVEGQTTLLGFRAFTSNNLAATLPFGTIDTPGQGDTVSGTVVNFGWALSSNLIATDGSTIDVVVDGVVVGHPVYNNFRPDIASLFPGLPNTNGAVGYYILDTTTLDNGVHTIAWVVRDSAGGTQGIGSRFFTVLN